MRLLLPLVFLLATLPHSRAESAPDSTNRFELAQGERMDHEAWLLFPTIQIGGEAANDLFLGGQSVRLTGTLEDDVWAAGMEVRFLGQAREDLRLLAQVVAEVDGEVGDALYVLGLPGNVVVGTNAVVHGDALLYGSQNISVSGHFHGDVYIEAPTVNLDARIDGTLTLATVDLTLSPDARIAGDLVYTAPKDLVIPDGIVGGTVRRDHAQERKLEHLLQRIALGLRVSQWIAAVGMGLLLLRVFPRFCAQSVELALYRRSACIFTGVVSLSLLGLMTYLFAASGIGLGLALSLGGGGFLLFLQGKLIAAIAFGALFFKRFGPLTFGKLALGMLLGLLVLYTLFRLPYIGLALWLLVSSWGFGAMLRVMTRSQRLTAPPDEPSATDSLSPRM